MSDNAPSLQLQARVQPLFNVQHNLDEGSSIA